MRAANPFKVSIRPVESVFAAALCCLLVGRYVFFSACILLGFDYSGSESSSAYSIAMGLLALVGDVFFLRQIMARRKISVQAIVTLSVVLLMGLVLVLTRDSYIAVSNLFVFYLVFSLPAFLVGISIDIDGRYGLRSLAKYLDLVMLLFSVAAIFYQLTNLSAGWSSRAFAGASYQMMSYIAALAFGLNLFSLAFPSGERFKFTGSAVWHVLQLCLLPIQVVCSFVSGGRGGLVLTAIYAVVFALAFVKGKNGPVRFIVMIPVLALVAVAILAMVDSSYFAQMPGVDRILSLRDNRSDVYDQAFNLISDNLFIGYGLGGYYPAMGGYCHNLFLDLVLSFGFPLTVFLIAFIAVPSIRTVRYFRNESIGSPLAVLAIFTVCHLFFSSTFVVDAGFWFFIGLVVNGFYQQPASSADMRFASCSAQR